MIGILTFQDTTNFGAMLQTYALHKKLLELNIDNEVIKYNNDFLAEHERPIELKRQKDIHGIIRYFVLHRNQKRKYKKFIEFFDKKIASNGIEYNSKNIQDITERYSQFLVGSDQVWNAEITNYDFNYLLDFVKNESKKTSYASSFGGYEIEKFVEKKYEKCLIEFSSILVRELDGKQMLEEKYGIKSSVVLDPTLLLEKEKWDCLLEKRIIKEKYVLVYFIERNRLNFKRIKDFAKENGLKIIYLQDFIKIEKGMKNVRDASPLDFINYIKYAEYVFTGSYHGLCFSLIYEKNVFMTISPAVKRQSRIDNLLQEIGLSFKDVSFDNVGKEKLNFLEIEKRLKKSRDKSIELLKESVGR